MQKLYQVTACALVIRARATVTEARAFLLTFAPPFAASMASDVVPTTDVSTHLCRKIFVYSTYILMYRTVCLLYYGTVHCQ